MKRDFCVFIAMVVVSIFMGYPAIELVVTVQQQERNLTQLLRASEDAGVTKEIACYDAAIEVTERLIEKGYDVEIVNDEVADINFCRCKNVIVIPL